MELGQNGAGLELGQKGAGLQRGLSALQESRAEGWAGPAPGHEDPGIPCPGAGCFVAETEGREGADPGLVLDPVVPGVPGGVELGSSSRVSEMK